MKTPSYFTTRRSAMELQMTPMIDVVFLLLVFFVWTASFHVAEYILPSSVSTAAGAGQASANDPPPPEADFDQVVVRILWLDDQPAWRINDQPLANLDQVRTQLDRIANIKRDAPVILHPDPLVPLGHVIDIYDIARLVRFEKVQFAASEAATK